MALLDALAAGVATLRLDADAANARWFAVSQANTDAVIALQAIVANLQAQLDAAVANQVDPAVVVGLEADIAAIDGVVVALGV